MSSHTPTTLLSEAKAGPILSVERLEGSDKFCRRLREVGICEKAEIRVVSRGGQMICNVCGTRLALSQKLAQKIWVKAAKHETNKDENKDKQKEKKITGMEDR